MKFIFSFLFGILILSPTFASYECTENTQQDQCNCAGWGWVNLDENSGFCEQCSETQYSPANDSVCHDCIDSNGNWAESITRPTHSIFDTNHATAGQSSCPWVCDDGYFDDTEHTQCLFCPTNTSGFMSYPDGETPTSDCANSCSGGKYIIETLSSTNATTHRYYCGECGLGTQSSNGVVSTCTCYNAPGVNRVYGGGPNRTTNRIECECPNEAEWNSSTQQCECSNNKVLAQNTDGEWYCADCPTNSTKRNNVCKCKPGYYGADNSPCTQCPTGMTTITNDNGYGATDSSACYMTGNTEFCINGATTSCLKFIPSGIKINVNGEVSAN